MVTWQAHIDDRTCLICMALNGYTWVFETGIGTTVEAVQGGTRTFLVHPEFGVIWDIHQGSKAHGHQRYNCRCGVDARIDISELRERIESIYNTIKAKYT